MTASEETADGGKAHWLSIKGWTLIIATVMSLSGSLGQFVFVEAADRQANGRAEEMRDIESHLTTLRDTQSQYYSSYVEGNLLFALNPADLTVNKGVVGQMYKLSILDRAFPFRAIMAELAVAGTFEFTPVNEKYKALSQTARDNYSYANYIALAGFEKDILDQAYELQGKLQTRYFAAQDERAAFEHQRDFRRTLLIAITTIGTVLLLAANLIAEQKSGD